MFRSLVTFVLCTLTLAPLMAQVEVLSVEPLKGTENQQLYHPQFSPQGDFLLFSMANYRGLMRYDLATAEMRQLTDADNAGYDVKISDGGKMVVFRDVQYMNHRRYTAIRRVNTITGDTATVSPLSREKYAFDFNGGIIRVARHSDILHQRLVSDLRPAPVHYVVGIEEMSLVLYRNNVRYVLNPSGDGSYIWPSISPDRQHIVYTVMKSDKTGTYVCDMCGQNVQALGYVGAPQWLGNEYIAGMLDIWDDGEKYTKSPIVTVRIDGTNRQMHEVPGHPIILYPAASQQGDKIAFEADGTVYLMNVKISE